MSFMAGVTIIMFLVGMVFWAGACLACCALVTSSPIGALACRFWARRHGLDVARCTRLGAFYWAVGFMPWIYFALQMNNRAIPRRLMRAAYAALFIGWLLGPVFAGFFWTSEIIDLDNRDWLILHPTASLLAWVAALVCLGFAEVLPRRQQRIDTCHVVPSLLGTLAMLTWLPCVLFVL